MSLAATAYVLHLPDLDASSKLLLVALADKAHDDGTAAFPSAQTLAGILNVDARTIRRKLRVLEDQGFIRRGDQRLVDHIRGDRRPVVYDVALTEQTRQAWAAETGSNERADILPPRERANVEPVDNSFAQVTRRDILSPRTKQPVDNSPRGDIQVLHGVTPVSYKPSIEQPNYHPHTPSEAQTETSAGPPAAAMVVVDDKPNDETPASGQAARRPRTELRTESATVNSILASLPAGLKNAVTLSTLAVEVGKHIEAGGTGEELVAAVRGRSWTGAGPGALVAFIRDVQVRREFDANAGREAEAAAKQRESARQRAIQVWREHVPTTTSTSPDTGETEVLCPHDWSTTEITSAMEPKCAICRHRLKSELSRVQSA